MDFIELLDFNTLPRLESVAQLLPLPVEVATLVKDPINVADPIELLRMDESRFIVLVNTFPEGASLMTLAGFTSLPFAFT